jgi:hypothetical protein
MRCILGITILHSDWSTLPLYIGGAFQDGGIKNNSILSNNFKLQLQRSLFIKKMHRDALKKLFNKFKKDELIDILLDKGFLDESFRRTNATKAATVSRVLKLLGVKLTNRQVAALDLICE